MGRKLHISARQMMDTPTFGIGSSMPRDVVYLVADHYNDGEPMYLSSPHPEGGRLILTPVARVSRRVRYLRSDIAYALRETKRADGYHASSKMASRIQSGQATMPRDMLALAFYILSRAG